MTIKNFITKGILPILLIGIITWLGQYIFMVDGSIDWFRFMLVYGVPIDTDEFLGELDELMEAAYGLVPFYMIAVFFNAVIGKVNKIWRCNCAKVYQHKG